MKDGEKFENEQILQRSANYTSVDGWFLSIAVTLFTLMLTIKIELLSSWMIATQLVLSICLWMGIIVSQAKIVNLESIKKYYALNKLSSGIAMAFTYNVIGLLIVKYVFFSTGLIFFAIFLFYNLYTLYGHIKARKKGKIFRDILIIAILVVGGILPSFGIFMF